MSFTNSSSNSSQSFERSAIAEGIDTSFESTGGFGSFLNPEEEETPAGYDPPTLPERVEEDLADGKNEGHGPDFKDQMRESYGPKDTTSLPNRQQHSNIPREFRNDELQLVSAALVPDEEFVVKKHQRRSKRMMAGLCFAVVLNALLVGGALVGVFCLAGGKCRRDASHDDDEMLGLTQCERAVMVNLANAKRRISGTIDSSRQGRLCDTGIPGKWFKVTGRGEPLFADTCSPLTDTDTTITVYSGDTCGSLTCVETNDDWYACSHGESFSQVGWFGALNETYYIRVSGYDEAALGHYSLAIREFSDQAPMQPCQLDARHECRSSDGIECKAIVSPRMNQCRGSPQSLQFKYLHARCDQVMEGVTCEDFDTPQSDFDNMTLGCHRSSGPLEIIVLNTAPRSFSHGELITLHSLSNEPLQEVIECDIANVETGARVQRVEFDLSITTLSIGDTIGSLHIVACDSTTCVQELSFQANLVNGGSEPIQTVESSIEVFIDNVLAFEMNDLITPFVLNAGDTVQRVVTWTFNLCEGSYYNSEFSVGGRASGGDYCWTSSFDQFVVDQLFPTTQPIPNFTQPASFNSPPPITAPSVVQPVPVPRPVAYAGPIAGPIPGPPPIPSPSIRTPQPTSKVGTSDPNSGPAESSETSGFLDSAVGRLILAFVAFVEVLLVACCAFSGFRCWQRRQERKLETLRTKQRELREKHNLNLSEEGVEADDSSTASH